MKPYLVMIYKFLTASWVFCCTSLSCLLFSPTFSKSDQFLTWGCVADKYHSISSNSLSPFESVGWDAYFTLSVILSFPVFFLVLPIFLREYIPAQLFSNSAVRFAGWYLRFVFPFRHWQTFHKKPYHWGPWFPPLKSNLFC